MLSPRTHSLPPVKSDQKKKKRRPATVLVTKNLNPTLHEKEADAARMPWGSVDRPLRLNLMPAAQPP